MKGNIPESQEVREHRVRESLLAATKRIAELEQKLIRRIAGEERYERAEEKNRISYTVIDSLSDEEFRKMREQDEARLERAEEPAASDEDEDAMLRAYTFLHKEAGSLVGDFHGFTYSGAEEGRISFGRLISQGEGAGIQHIAFSAEEGAVVQTEKSRPFGEGPVEAAPDIPAEEALAAAELVLRRFEELDVLSDQDLRDLAGEE